MANIATGMQTSLLNWALNNAAVTRPTAWGIGLSLGSPTSTSASEIPVGSSNVTRQTGSFAPATAVASSATCTNSNNVTFSNLSAGSFSGLDIFDTAATAGGGLLFYGLLTTPRTTLAGDALVIASGALTVSLF